MKNINALFILISSITISFAQQNPCTVAEVSEFVTGTTITQNTLFGNSQAIQNGQNAIYTSSPIVNQHVMGFGALNPEPYTDQYNLTSLIERIGITNGVVKDAETIVLTACCAPDWMKGGQQGDSFVLPITDAPFPEHYDDYAELVAYIVQQPEFANIKYLLVWNELKGFFMEDELLWDSIGYTNLYNEVYNAVKEVRDDIKIGGPYVPLDSWHNSIHKSGVGGEWGEFDARIFQVMNYWLRENDGADFIVVDGHSGNKDGKPPGVNQWQMTDKFTDFMIWLRNHPNIDAQTLPVWWAEWYVKTDDPNSNALETNALMTVALIKLLKSGVETALLWSAQGDEEGFINDEFTHQLALFTSTFVNNGGQQTLYYNTQKYINDYFSTGNNLIDLESPNSQIDLLASNSKILSVNKSNTTQTFNLSGSSFTLSPHQVLLFDTPSDLVGGNSSHTINCNYILNPDFENDINGWQAEQCDISQNQGACYISNILTVSNPWDAKVFYSDMCLRENVNYTVSFKARSNANRNIQVKIGQTSSPYTSYFQVQSALQTSMSVYQYNFTMSDDSSIRIEFHLGESLDDVFIDDVILKETACEQDNPCNLITNSNFEQNDESWYSWNADTYINSNSEYIIKANPIGVNPWDAAASFRDIQLFQNRTYIVNFQARTLNLPRQIYLKVGLGQEPWTSFLWKPISLSTAMNSYSFMFTMNNPNTSNASIEFQIGGDDGSVMIDNVLLKPVDCIPNNPCESITNSYFDKDLSNWEFWRCNANRNNQKQCLLNQIENMPNPWDCVFRSNEITLTQSYTYDISFDARSVSDSRDIYVKVGLGIAPYASYSWQQISLIPEMNHYRYSFIMNEPNTSLARLEFQIGGNTTDIILDNISLVENSCVENLLIDGDCPQVLYVSGDIASASYSARQKLVSDGTIPSSQTVMMRAGFEIILDTLFSVEESSVFEAEIQDCQ